MNAHRMMMAILAVLLLCSTDALAGDFDWVKDFNIQAQADPTGFRVRLATRFQIGDAQVKVVLDNVPDPADAYMVFKLSELSHHPPEEVLREYRSGKGKGWGALAKSLGIKPGSKEFHALKKGHDLDSRDRGRGKKGKGKKNKE